MPRAVPVLFDCGHEVWLDDGTQPADQRRCDECEQEYQDARPRQTTIFDAITDGNERSRTT